MSLLCLICIYHHQFFLQLFNWYEQSPEGNGIIITWMSTWSVDPAAYQLNSSAAVHPNALVGQKAAHIYFSKPPRRNTRSLYSIDNNNSPHWRLFVISYMYKFINQPRAEVQSLAMNTKCLYSARESSSSIRNDIQNIYILICIQRGEYYFRHVPEKQKGAHILHKALSLWSYIYMGICISRAAVFNLTVWNL
jgi:hypothetical protein